jgi:hypothetical protein
MMDRRDFLKTIAVASLPLPLIRLDGKSPASFFLTPTGECRPVNDPVAWILANARQPFLERAKERLLQLSPSDHTRILRLVTRRCHFNLIEIEPQRVVVHHWGRTGLADLRPFFKQQRLTGPKVEIVLVDRKREVSTVKPGDDFLYGERLAPDWPLSAYLQKWERRDQLERDDWTAAPGTCSGFAWVGITPNRIPWAAMKSAWRRATPFQCPNCGQPTILVNFGLVQVGMCNRLANFIHVCHRCSRSFKDYSIGEVKPWLVKNLDAEVWPDHELIWGNLVKWAPTKPSVENVGGWIEWFPS